MRYASKRHRHLMQESAQALEDAAHSVNTRQSRIAQQVLTDPRKLNLWESRHANLLLPLSEERRYRQQVHELRRLKTRLLHSASLIDYIRKHRVSGDERNRLFHAFYGPRDLNNAILLEHQKYLVAESSQVSSDHLMNLLCDPVSAELYDVYQSAYSAYFALYCYAACAENSALEDAVRFAMREARARCERIRKRLLEAQPEGVSRDLDEGAMLARSGRFRALSYFER